MKSGKILVIASFIANFLLLIILLKATFRTPCFSSFQLIAAYILLVASLIANILSILEKARQKTW